MTEALYESEARGHAIFNLFVVNVAAGNQFRHHRAFFLQLVAGHVPFEDNGAHSATPKRPAAIPDFIGDASGMTHR